MKVIFVFYNVFMFISEIFIKKVTDKMPTYLLPYQ